MNMKGIENPVYHKVKAMFGSKLRNVKGFNITYSICMKSSETWS